MKLLTESQRAQRLANGRKKREAVDNGTEPLDFATVVNLFTPDRNAT